MDSAKKIRARKLKKDESVKDLEDSVEKLVNSNVSNKKIGTRKIRCVKEVEAGKAKNVEEKSVQKRVKTHKIRMSLTSAEEKKLDKEIEQEDKMSVAAMIFILLICFVVGISLGYLLYRIAINGAI